MRGGRTEDARRPAPTWMRLAGLVVLLVITVQSFGAAWALMSTPTEDCPTVVDDDPGRGIDYECSSDGGESKGTAVLVLLGLGLVAGTSFLWVLAAPARRRRRTQRVDSQNVEALEGDLATLDDLHERGLLTHEEHRAARDRRRRRG